MRRFDDKDGVLVLAYHDIVNDLGGDEARASDVLRHQLSSLINRGSKPLSIDEYMDGQGERGDFLVTFDDGYKSLLDCALPVLTDLGIPAVVYIVTGFVGRKADRPGAAHLGSPAHFLSWADLSTLQDQGVEIGGHTVSHKPLNELSSEELFYEIDTSTRILRENGFRCATFAYPYGRYDDRAKKAVVEAGYTSAVSVMKGGGDSYEIRRRMTYTSQTERDFRVKMSRQFFLVREAARTVVPNRLLVQEKPMPKEMWGPFGFGLDEVSDPRGIFVE